MPESVLDIAKRMCDPFLTPDSTERLFDKLREELHELYDDGGGVGGDHDVLRVLTTVVDTIRTEWQSQQPRVEVETKGKRLCTATATVSMITPGVVQLCMVCHGPYAELQAELITKSISTMRRAVKDYVEIKKKE